jgi:hypothetical protein
MTTDQGVAVHMSEVHAPRQVPARWAFTGMVAVVIAAVLVPSIALADHSDADGFITVDNYDHLGHELVTSNQGGIATEADITGTSVTVTVDGSNRLLRISGSVFLVGWNGGVNAVVEIEENGTLLQTGQVHLATGGQGYHVPISVLIEAPSSGTHTYNLAVYMATGSGTITNYASSAYPTFILVEDLGPAT